MEAEYKNSILIAPFLIAHLPLFSRLKPPLFTWYYLRTMRLSGALPLGLAVLTTTVISVPHEGHHGYHEPGSEFKSTTISSSSNASTSASPHRHPASGHDHSHKGVPLETLNETQVLQGHAPDPLSYVAFDLYGERQGYKSGWGEDAFDMVVYGSELKGHGWMMVWHIGFMSAAFFGALPVGGYNALFSPVNLRDTSR